MLCQVCQQNQATIHLQMMMNGQKMQIDLCQDCYQKMQNMQMNLLNGGSDMNNGFGFGSLEDFMNAMNNMQNQPESKPTPRRRPRQRQGTVSPVRD